MKIQLFGVTLECLQNIDKHGELFTDRLTDEDFDLAPGITLKKGSKITNLQWSPATDNVELATGQCPDGYDVIVYFMEPTT